jgi:hypothetical protein
MKMKRAFRKNLVSDPINGRKMYIPSPSSSVYEQHDINEDINIEELKQSDQNDEEYKESSTSTPA